MTSLFSECSATADGDVDDDANAPDPADVVTGANLRGDATTAAIGECEESLRPRARSPKALVSIFLAAGSCLAGKRLRMKGLGSMSTTPLPFPLPLPSSSGWRREISAMIFSKRWNSSSGYARKHVVKYWQNPAGVRPGISGR